MHILPDLANPVLFFSEKRKWNSVSETDKIDVLGIIVRIHPISIKKGKRSPNSNLIPICQTQIDRLVLDISPPIEMVDVDMLLIAKSKVSQGIKK